MGGGARDISVRLKLEINNNISKAVSVENAKHVSDNTNQKYEMKNWCKMEKIIITANTPDIDIATEFHVMRRQLGRRPLNESHQRTSAMH